MSEHGVDEQATPVLFEHLCEAFGKIENHLAPTTDRAGHPGI